MSSEYRYLFASADPINNIDPTGFITVGELGKTIGIGTIIGSLGAGAVSGVVAAASGQGVQGSIHAVGRSAGLGSLAGAAIGYGIATGTLPDILVSGTFGGTIHILVEALIITFDEAGDFARGPIPYRLWDAFLSGFAFSATTQVLSGPFGDRRALAAMASGGISILTGALDDILKGKSVNWPS